MSNYYLDYVASKLAYLVDFYADTGDDEAAAFFADILDHQQAGVLSVEEQSAVDRMLGDRNPAFDGDMIGWLDDDFSK